MWFQRKLKNRRLGRESVLEVKLRSSKVRSARLRLAAVGAGVVFSLVLGGFLVWHAGHWMLNRLVYENSAFAIERIEVQTDGAIPVEQLRRWMGVKPGDNLFALDLLRVAHDLELVSLIQSVSVERIPPHALRVRVTEREPLAQVHQAQPRPGGGVDLVPFQLDLEGYVLMPLEIAPGTSGSAGASAASESLPFIDGINPRSIQVGHRIESPQLQAALQLVAAFVHSPMNGLVDLKRINISSPEVLVVTTGQGSEVTFGLSELDQQLRRWHEIFDMAQRLSKGIATLDLAVSNNIPARWLEASAGTVPPTKPAKPLHPKKRHV